MKKVMFLAYNNAVSEIKLQIWIQLPTALNGFVFKVNIQLDLCIMYAVFLMQYIVVQYLHRYMTPQEQINKDFQSLFKSKEFSKRSSWLFLLHWG